MFCEHSKLRSEEDCEECACNVWQQQPRYMKSRNVRIEFKINYDKTHLSRVVSRGKMFLNLCVIKCMLRFGGIIVTENVKGSAKIK